MKRVLLCLLTLLLLTGCGETPATVTLPGEGYRSLTEVNGTCYLVENSGIIYTLDWYTGEKTVYYKPPADIAWAAAPDMTHIYYMNGADLHCIDIGADKDEVLCEMPVLEGLLDPFLGVTDHFLIYKQVVNNITFNVWCINLETQATRLLLNSLAGEFDVLIAAQGDTAYLSYHCNGARVQDKFSRISAMDLSTGKETILAELPAAAYIQYPFNPVTNTFRNALADGVLYYENSRYRTNDDPRNLQNECALCAVPANGSVEEKRLTLTGAVQGSPMCLSPDAKLLAVPDPDRGLVLYRYDSAADTAAELTCLKSLNSVHCAVTNGARYALLASDGNRAKLILGDLE